MNLRTCALPLMLVFVACASALHAAQMPIFRASTDLVSVHVSVSRPGNTRSDLGLDDFVVYDAGVRQSLELVSREDLPVDVTLFLDTSGSLSDWRNDLHRDVTAIMGILRPVDRLRLLTLDYEVDDVFGWRAPGKETTFAMPPVGRISAVYDAILLALIRRPEPDRRHLVVALTDGDDWSSITSSSELLDAAGRTDAVLHIVRIVSASSASSRPNQWSSVRPNSDAPSRLEQTAARTGGRLHPTPAAGRRVVDAFRQAFDDFRSGYVIRYAYEGPMSDGWHDIKVEVANPRRGDRVLRSRGGYFGKTGLPPKPAS